MLGYSGLPGLTDFQSKFWLDSNELYQLPCHVGSPSYVPPHNIYSRRQYTHMVLLWLSA